MNPAHIRNAQKATIEFLADCPTWFQLLLNGSTIGATPFYTLTFKDDDFDKMQVTIFSSSIPERKVYITATRANIEEAVQAFILLNPWLILEEEMTVGYGINDFENDRVTAEIPVKLHDLMSADYVASVNKFLANFKDII